MGRFNTIYSSQMFYSSSRGSAVDSSYFPAVIYANADTQKLQILRENKGKCGVYM